MKDPIEIFCSMIIYVTAIVCATCVAIAFIRAAVTTAPHWMSARKLIPATVPVRDAIHRNGSSAIHN